MINKVYRISNWISLVLLALFVFKCILDGKEDKWGIVIKINYLNEKNNYYLIKKIKTKTLKTPHTNNIRMKSISNHDHFFVSFITMTKFINPSNWKSFIIIFSINQLFLFSFPFILTKFIQLNINKHLTILKKT